MLTRTLHDDGRRGTRCRRAVPVLAAAAVACLALVGCRQSEQGRTLLFSKGTYLGQQDSKLSPEQRAALNGRVTLQASGTGLPTRETPADSASDLRLSAGGDGLSNRTRQQSDQ